MISTIPCVFDAPLGTNAEKLEKILLLLPHIAALRLLPCTDVSVD